MFDLLPLEPRREPTRFGRLRRGAHKPLAIRWFGMTALAGHVRHLLAVTAASNQLGLKGAFTNHHNSVKPLLTTFNRLKIEANYAA